MTEEEQAIAIDRIGSEGRDSHGKLDWSVFRRIFGSWQFYVFPMAYMYVLAGARFLLREADETDFVGSRSSRVERR